jgi:FixJ family two-component response regulator
MTGPGLRKELTLRREEIPSILITAAHGYKNIQQGVLESGAVARLFKPFSDTKLQEALNAALR